MSRLAQTTRGEGPRATVLLHGFLGSGRNLASLARRWAERDASRRFVLPDLLGHGTSPALPAGADLDALAEPVVELLGELAAPVDLIGHSLGGRVALRTRARAPHAVASVTILDVAPGPIPKAAGDLEPVLDALLAAPASAPNKDALRRPLLERGVSPALADWLLMNLAPTPEGEQRWRIDRQALAALHQKTRAADLWPDVEGAATPTHAVRGGVSRFVSDADVSRLRAAGVETHTVPGAGHFVHVDALDALLDVLLRLYSPQ